MARLRTLLPDLATKGQVLRPKRAPKKQSKRRRGGQQKLPAPHRAPGWGLYAFRNPCPWGAILREHGAASSLHKHFRQRLEPGFWERLWRAGMERSDELEGSGWAWERIDGSMVKASLVLEAVGGNPTDRGKNGNQAQHMGPKQRSSPCRSGVRCEQPWCQTPGGDLERHRDRASIDGKRGCRRAFMQWSSWN